MANEFRHKDVGTDLSKAEWEGVDSHEADSQSSGDGLYFDGSNWKRSAGINRIPVFEPLVISGGSVTPTLPDGLYAHLLIYGELGLDDDLTAFVLPSSWIGKRIVVRMGDEGIITVKHSYTIITKTDFTLDSIYDTVEYECVAVNTVIQISRSDNV
ncbi:MAG: hypothetical protein WC998_04750 [Candidatus Paceibacterota bacterium]|jgi:hypothetical protein